MHHAQIDIPGFVVLVFDVGLQLGEEVGFGMLVGLGWESGGLVDHEQMIVFVQDGYVHGGKIREMIMLNFEG
jgi:hypothetical protein